MTPALRILNKVHAYGAIVKLFGKHILKPGWVPRGRGLVVVCLRGSKTTPGLLLPTERLTVEEVSCISRARSRSGQELSSSHILSKTICRFPTAAPAAYHLQRG
ncbi:hypothetical protein ILYODFUR_003188 [Ilyodon furcidens]|uniref:Uncharacterized protein n=1 Tax=Ilyodon furcidens TaxID=33524 RepID=A0ABV0U675_9TELE